MKILTFSLWLLAICVSASGHMHNPLLTREDLELQELDNVQGVALSSESNSEWPWESYNVWQCFDTNKLNYDCADYDYGTLVPSLRIATEQRVLHFDVHVEDQLDCQQTLIQWQHLIAQGNEVCIFAAHMPDVEMGLDRNKSQSLWYINRLKGAGGYWDLFEPIPN